MIESDDDSTVSRNHDDCMPEDSVNDDAWGPNDCNHIAWNGAVCSYPHFVSADSAATTWQGGKEKDVSSYSQWKTEGNWDCSESPPVNPGPKWIVKLQPPMPDDHRDGDEDEACRELAQTTYNLYLKSLFEGWGGEHVFDNEYDGHEDDGWDKFDLKYNI